VSSSDTSLDVYFARFKLKLVACAADTLRRKTIRTLWHPAHSSKEVSDSSHSPLRSPRFVLSFVRCDSDRAFTPSIFVTLVEI
jgi:hypothetical protein